MVASPAATTQGFSLPFSFIFVNKYQNCSRSFFSLRQSEIRNITTVSSPISDRPRWRCHLSVMVQTNTMPRNRFYTTIISHHICTDKADGLKCTQNDFLFCIYKQLSIKQRNEYAAAQISS